MKKFAKVLAVALVCVLAVAALVACAPNSDPDKAVSALKKNGYTATKIPSLLGAGGLICTVTGIGSSEDKDGNKKVEIVVIYYYGSADEAKAALASVKSDSEKDKNKNDSDWTVAQSGKIVYYGTKAAINAAR